MVILIKRFAQFLKYRHSRSTTKKWTHNKMVVLIKGLQIKKFQNQRLKK